MAHPVSRRQFALATTSAVCTCLAGCTDAPLERASGVVAKNLHTAEHTLAITLVVDGDQVLSETITLQPATREEIDRRIPGPRFVGTAEYSVTARLDEADPVSRKTRRDASFDHVGVTIGPDLTVDIDLEDAR